MSLKQYEGRNVRIVDVDDQTFEGLVTDYVYSEDDETELESIIIRCSKGREPDERIEFWEKDIKTIEII